MKYFEEIESLRRHIALWRQEGCRVGFVPTMGCLHDGHLSLIHRAHDACDRVVASIFVNPLQFSVNEDYSEYPQDIESDSAKLNDAGVHVLFAPSVEEMYPDDQKGVTNVYVSEISNILCGVMRPGHFEGVATVVTKLFNIVQPDVAVFGCKDFQQLVVIRKLVADLSFPVEIIGAATGREPDGLAMSSRNVYLNDAQRRIAPRLFKMLKKARDRVLAGDHNYEKISVESTTSLELAGFRPDYFELRRADDLQAADENARRVVWLTAARLGHARLIDNLEFDMPVK